MPERYRRRIFYKTETGEVLSCYTARGAIDSNFSIADEAAALGLTNCGCLEWTEPDEAIEAAFAPVDAEGKARLVTVTVDVSGAEPKLVFVYEPMPEPGTNEKSDMAAALALLGVVPEEEEV